MQKLSLAAAFAALLGACGQSEPVAVQGAGTEDAEIAFSNDDERTLYAIGVAVGENVDGNLSDFDLTEDEYELVLAGIGDVIRDADYRVDMDVFRDRIQTFANERFAARAAEDAAEEKAASAAFADEIAAEPGAERFESGLVFVPMVEGDGAMPAATDTVRVHYHGTLRDGTVFDSSVERGAPVEFPLNGVIDCWTEGVQKIRIGGKAKLACPSDIAYGDLGSPGGIPGGATLLFEVELLGIVE